MCDDAAKAPASGVLPAVPAEDVATAQEHPDEIVVTEEISIADESATGETAEAVAPSAASGTAVTQDAGASTGAAVVESATGLVPGLLGGLPSTGLR